MERSEDVEDDNRRCLDDMIVHNGVKPVLPSIDQLSS